ncbi:hypothetical protein MMC19_007417 [Ptychographa xylographoides]|nr:hypothetical protein [Ptychographa xylographoides]
MAPVTRSQAKREAEHEIMAPLTRSRAKREAEKIKDQISAPVARKGTKRALEIDGGEAQAEKPKPQKIRRRAIEDVNNPEHLEKPKRKPGRPRKEPTPLEDVNNPEHLEKPKRKPGRPRKEPTPLEDVNNPEHLERPKRKPGRPRKEPTPLEDVNNPEHLERPKRKPGRPRKEPTPLDDNRKEGITVRQLAPKKPGRGPKSGAKISKKRGRPRKEPEPPLIEAGSNELDEAGKKKKGLYMKFEGHMNQNDKSSENRRSGKSSQLDSISAKSQEPSESSKDTTSFNGEDHDGKAEQLPSLTRELKDILKFNLAKFKAQTKSDTRQPIVQAGLEMSADDIVLSIGVVWRTLWENELRFGFALAPVFPLARAGDLISSGMRAVGHGTKALLMPLTGYGRDFRKTFDELDAEKTNKAQRDNVIGKIPKMKDLSANRSGHHVVVIAERDPKDQDHVHLTIYDSCPSCTTAGKVEEAAQQVVRVCGWMGLDDYGNPTLVDPRFTTEQRQVPVQMDSFSCGLHVVLNTWSYILGIRIVADESRRRETAHGRGFAADGRDILNLACKGAMDTTTIQAYFNYYGYSATDDTDVFPLDISALSDEDFRAFMNDLEATGE